jgi:hypothetical protein
MLSVEQIVDEAESYVGDGREAVPAIRQLIGSDIGSHARGETAGNEANERAVAAAVIEQFPIRMRPGKPGRHSESGSVTPSNDGAAALKLL